MTGSVEIGSQITVKLMNASVVKADVIKKGPVPVIFVSSFFCNYIQKIKLLDNKNVNFNVFIFIHKYPLSIYPFVKESII